MTSTPARDRPAATPARPNARSAAPKLVPLLRPLSPRDAAIHDIRNRLTYIAGTARTLRRRAEKDTLDPEDTAARLERIERAAWEIESALQSLPK